ncbi:single-stranded DNA-binding protein [Nocardia puris]|uniref:Single-stranded DNA-binding protein n=1 Tax=Nocardia puris TaxID=208602 RepID=A0A366D542_9NOCA|nr:single-stranded DNA-binding protein [Nocardia puris]MBF6215938.1 single-stranded DNA-binding protein [Nocardia puris]MBF6370290.1 single-stranded DNA-binding protein [Nocardia puris]RBO85157.1 single-strand DNA-binding protein [Nocardia puris]
MAGDTTLTVIGNLTADPDLRVTPGGVAVASFTVASTPRFFDRMSGEWKDGEVLFLRCNIWREAADNAVASLVRGSRVIVQGRLKQRSFDTREGEKRTVVELEVDEIGPSLRFATAKVSKTSSGSSTRVSPAADLVGARAGGGDDPWASSAFGAGVSGDGLDQPPF